MREPSEMNASSMQAVDVSTRKAPTGMSESAVSGLSRERLQQLYDQYFALVRLEVEEFAVKPTEVRHLIGRLGEFYCALTLNGTLSHTANQHGFDVRCSLGRRVSVKTTAQALGFVSVGQSTLHQVDDLMIVHYSNGGLSTLYYGAVEHALADCRVYQGRYELDLGRARRLMALL